MSLLSFKIKSLNRLHIMIKKHKGQNHYKNFTKNHQNHCIMKQMMKILQLMKKIKKYYRKLLKKSGNKLLKKLHFIYHKEPATFH